MSQPIVYILLLFVLLLPVLGAVLLRVLTPRLLPQQLYFLAAGIFSVVILSTLVLARSEVPSVQIGRLSLLLPVSPPDEPAPAPEVAAPTAPAVPAPTAAPAPAIAPEPTATPAPEPTATPAPEPTATPAPEPTATPAPEPTATPAPEPTATPAPEPTATPAAAPGGQRRYTVQPGDTLRSIAEQFNVSVQAIIEANQLTPAQADSLRVGQELIIP